MKDCNKKIDVYFYLIDRHIIKPIEEGILDKSCYATTILLFTAIDSLGKLTHPKAKVGVAVRFKYFISTLGKNYEKNKDVLWTLRNSLMHNGLNPISFFASTFMGQDEHLNYFGPNDMIYINTRKFYHDFKDRFENLKKEILKNETEIERIENRLEWAEEETDSYMFNRPVTSPGTIYFVIEK
jgi:hypothetical protein